MGDETPPPKYETVFCDTWPKDDDIPDIPCPPYPGLPTITENGSQYLLPVNPNTRFTTEPPPSYATVTGGRTVVDVPTTTGPHGQKNCEFL